MISSLCDVTCEVDEACLIPTKYPCDFGSLRFNSAVGDLIILTPRPLSASHRGGEKAGGFELIISSLTASFNAFSGVSL